MHSRSTSRSSLYGLNKDGTRNVLYLVQSSRERLLEQKTPVEIPFVHPYVKRWNTPLHPGLFALSIVTRIVLRYTLLTTQLTRLNFPRLAKWEMTLTNTIRPLPLSLSLLRRVVPPIGPPPWKPLMPNAPVTSRLALGP